MGVINFFWLLLLLLHNISAVPDSNHNGVVFNYHRKILLTENFEKLQFVLPFPVFDSQID